MNKKTVLILSYTRLSSDPRVLRQISALKENFNIITAGLSPVNDENIKFYPIYTLPPFSLARKLKRLFLFVTRKFDQFYWDAGKKNLMHQLRKNNIDAIIANDIHTLPLALAIDENKPKVYFDAHEYYPREFEDVLMWNLLSKRMVEFQCKKYIPKASAFSTVSEGIAMEYQKFTGIKPFLITNATSYQNMEPSNSNSDKIKIIHHTAAYRSRKIELMIEMMKFLDDRFVFDLILVGNELKYIQELKNFAKGNERIRFLPPVDYNDICSFTNSYDIGIILWPNTNFNYLHGLPNKFFEFVQARLALAVSPSPDMAFLVKKYDLGVVADDFTAETMANAIKSLTKDKIIHHKKQSHLYAMALSAEGNIKKINTIISGLVSE